MKWKWFTSNCGAFISLCLNSSILFIHPPTWLLFNARCLLFRFFKLILKMIIETKTCEFLAQFYWILLNSHISPDENSRRYLAELYMSDLYFQLDDAYFTRCTLHNEQRDWKWVSAWLDWNNKSQPRSSTCTFQLSFVSLDSQRLLPVHQLD